MKRLIRLFITGFTMGTTDLIPGVSGGTIAFVSGIYEELIYSVRVLTGTTVNLLLKLRFADAAKSVPWKFLSPLLLGMFTAIFSLAGLLSHLLDTNGRLVWSFFFGLVVASIYVVAKRVVKWDLSDIIAFALTGIITFFLMGLRPTETSTSLPVVFLSGTIAIVAMILPGISGSFILVLLGKYQYILDSVTEKRFLVLFVFALGCAFGLGLFSRALNWLFTKHHDKSVTILAGFMLGSLRAIWPFGESFSSGNESHMSIIGLMILGAMIITIIARLDGLKERTSDINNSQFQEEHDQAIQAEK